MFRQTSRLIRVGATFTRPLTSQCSPGSSGSSSPRPPPEEFYSSTSTSILSPSPLRLSCPIPSHLENDPVPPPTLNILSLSLYCKAGVGVPGILDPIQNRLPLGSPSPSTPNLEYIIPGAANYSGNIMEDPLPSLRIPSRAPIQEAPSSIPGGRIEKQAARLIVIRRIKMNKHKLRKLRKKMHYKWTKIKERRYIRKEKAYLDEQLGKIHAAMKFDAKDYVADVIKRAKEEPLPRKWTDPLMPEWFREQEMAKEARLKRFQKVVNMYLNKGIKIKIDV